MDNYAQARRRMVEYQIEARGVCDERVLQAMLEVPRHLFLSESQWHHAYEDHPLPLLDGQTISQPYIVAAMTEALQVEAEHKVLEIGTGSGYQTAILARLAKMVYTIELLPELSRAAQAALQGLGVTNVELRVGDGHEGWPEKAPFDRIMVTAAADVMPGKLVEQLVDGGRIVLPVGGAGGQVLTMGVKNGAKLVYRHLMGVSFVPFVRARKHHHGA